VTGQECAAHDGDQAGRRLGVERERARLIGGRMHSRHGHGTTATCWQVRRAQTGRHPGLRILEHRAR
jgi:hypothetical protein